MCSIVILRQSDNEWPLIIGANRDEMASRKDKPLHDLINDALTNDIRDISKFAFLFPQQNQLNIKADSLVKSIGVVADRIKDYKREERLTKAKTIDITPTKIEE